MPKKKRILFVGSFKKSNTVKGGQNTASILLEKALKSHYKVIKIDSTMISIPPPNLFIRAFFAMKRIVFFLFLAPTCKSIIIFSADGLSFIEKGLMAIIGKLLMRNVIFCPRSGYLLEQLDKSILLKMYLKIIGFFSNHIVCQSQFWKDQFSRHGLKYEKLIVINNWIDIKLNNKEILNNSPIKVLYLGWITREKGIFDLIAAAQKVPSMKFIFYICGDGKDINKIRDKIESSGKNNIILKGWISGDEKLNLFKSCDAFIFPSHSEGFPNAILEAMMHKLSIVASDTTSLPDIIQHKKNGLLFAAKNIKDLEDTILLLDNFKLRKEMTENAYNQLEKRFSVKSAKQKFMRIL
ncbi:MAG: glycosyltransferase family 1 protein [Flavobacteriales bacterium TMED96]|nr:MAG: glycosyltransferase family 1 protein [Flavobacteriales bacterium TMED96]|tara:strand:- start:24661 stop:25716 length:1056 start_codon:yes stop_codon:yes gene_type:complete